MSRSGDDSTEADAPSRKNAFPHAPAGWSPALAEDRAREEGLELGTEHWELIRALHEYFARHGEPNRRRLRDALDERFHVRGGIRHLYHLFPGGPVAQGCRIAGLPSPLGNVDRGFGSVV